MAWSVDVESRECPRSALERDPEALVTIERYVQAQRLRTATGGVLYGPDASLWPARWVDAVALLAAEEERADAARERAFAQYRSASRERHV